MRASPIACRRCLGSLIKHRCTNSRILCGVFSGSCESSGSPRTTAASLSVIVSPSNAGIPVSISYSTQPNAQMSARRSTDLPLACSGDMYPAVPSNTPAAVAATLMVGEVVDVSLRAISGQRLRQSKIKNPGLTIRRDFNICRLQVPVNNSSLVRVFQAVSDLLCQHDGLFQSHGPFGNPFCQRRSVY